jgi:transcription antitermination factor NusG
MNTVVTDHQVPWPWFALQTKYRHEQVVATQLLGKGYEPFLPACKSRRRWSDRVKEIEQPLFAGYLFCRFDPHNRLPILTTAGIVQIVGTGKIPVPVDETEIAQIQTAVRSGVPTQAWPFQRIGQRVTVERGPLRGLEGSLLSMKGRHRLIVSVTLLQRSVAIELEESWVRPMPVQLPSSPVLASVHCGSSAR